MIGFSVTFSHLLCLLFSFWLPELSRPRWYILMYHRVVRDDKMLKDKGRIYVVKKNIPYAQRQYFGKKEYQIVRNLITIYSLGKENPLLKNEVRNRFGWDSITFNTCLFILFLRIGL